MQKITRKTGKLARKMDKQMSAVLTGEQYLRYEEYRALLLVKQAAKSEGTAKQLTTSVNNMSGIGSGGP